MRSSFSQDLLSKSFENKYIEKENQCPLGNYFTNKDKQRSNVSPLTLGLNKISTQGYHSQVALKKKTYGINELENLNLINNYNREFLKQNKSMNHSGFLSRHDVTCLFRAKMVDWMIEVMVSYKCSDRSLFKAVEIMDKYYLKSQKVEKPQDLHLIGVTAILIANKMQQVCPLKIKVLHDKIAHRKLSIQQISKKEADIFKVLDYNLNVHSLLDCVQIALATFCINSQHYEKLQKIATYITKMVSYQYSILSSFCKQVISYAIVQYSLRKGQQMIRRFNATPYLSSLRKQSKQKKSSIVECYDNIRKLIKNFATTYHSLPNFNKFSKVVIEGKNIRSYL